MIWLVVAAVTVLAAAYGLVCLLSPFRWDGRARFGVRGKNRLRSERRAGSV